VMYQHEGCSEHVTCVAMSCVHSIDTSFIFFLPLLVCYLFLRYVVAVVLSRVLILFYSLFIIIITVMTASGISWSEFLATDPEVRVRFPALPDFLRSSGSGTGSTHPREYN
jgi:hypothetical protein